MVRGVHLYAGKQGVAGSIRGGGIYFIKIFSITSRYSQLGEAHPNEINNNNQSILNGLIGSGETVLVPCTEFMAMLSFPLLLVSANKNSTRTKIYNILTR